MNKKMILLFSLLSVSGVCFGGFVEKIEDGREGYCITLNDFKKHLPKIMFVLLTSDQVRWVMECSRSVNAQGEPDVFLKDFTLSVYENKVVVLCLNGRFCIYSQVNEEKTISNIGNMFEWLQETYKNPA